MNYKGKVALVTGANSGIGEAIVHRLAERGCTVMINGRREEENQRVAQDLRQKYDATAHILTGDVSEEETCLRLVRETVEKAGKLDVLVNNAGIGTQGKRVADSDTETFDRLIKTNLYSCFWLSREGFQVMEKQDIAPDTGLRGAIINMSSILGVESWENAGMYSASKHGVQALTRAMTEEGHPAAIRVAAVCPALVTTAMTGVSGEEYIQPEDIAATVTYLLELSPAAWPTEVVVRRRGAE
jgi:3-oxoacyl-[acyl-carrier protein] reductase